MGDATLRARTYWLDRARRARASRERAPARIVVPATGRNGAGPTPIAWEDAPGLVDEERIGTVRLDRVDGDYDRLVAVVAGPDGTPIETSLGDLGGRWRYAFGYGGPGTGNGQFADARHMAVTAGGDLWIADYNNDRLQKFSPDGTYLAQFGTSGTGNGQFQAPFGVAIDPATGDIYVSDAGRQDIQRFSSTGAYLGKFGGPGTGNGQFSAPAGIAISRVGAYAATGTLYAVDWVQERVQQFLLDGTFVRAWGSSGGGAGQFGDVYDVAVDPAGGDVYTVEWGFGGTPRVQVFDADGTYLRSWGSYGDGEGQLFQPNAVEVDRDGYVWVADNYGRVQKFTPLGTFLEAFGGQRGGVTASGPGLIWQAWGLALDDAGRVHVTDPNGDRISVFAPGPPAFELLTLGVSVPDDGATVASNASTTTWTEHVSFSRTLPRGAWAVWVRLAAVYFGSGGGWRAQSVIDLPFTSSVLTVAGTSGDRASGYPTVFNGLDSDGSTATTFRAQYRRDAAFATTVQAQGAALEAVCWRLS